MLFSRSVRVAVTVCFAMRRVTEFIQISSFSRPRKEQGEDSSRKTVGRWKKEGVQRRLPADGQYLPSCQVSRRMMCSCIEAS